jgi:hypothetical protein
VANQYFNRYQDFREAAIAELKRRNLPELIIVLNQSPTMQTVAAVWGRAQFEIDRRKGKVSKVRDKDITKCTEGELIELVWQGIDPNFDTIGAVLGPGYPVSIAYRQLVEIGAVFPDGTRHPEVDAFITQLAKNLKAKQSKPPRTGSGRARSKGKRGKQRQA